MVNRIEFQVNIGADVAIDLLPPTTGYEGDNVVLDFSGVGFLRPCAMVTIAAWRHAATKAGLQVDVQKPNDDEKFQIMQALNFFQELGVYEQEDFNRRDQTGRFCRMSRIDWECDEEKLAREMLHTIRNAQDATRQDLVTCLSESASNIKAHAQANGYAIAQSFDRDTPNERYELVICDSGRGVKASASENSELKITDDCTALDIVCQRGTSREHENCSDKQHFGQGLFEIDRIATSSGGTFELRSGNFTRKRKGASIEYRCTKQWDGTLIHLILSKSGMEKWHDQQRQDKPGGVLRRGEH